MAQGVRKHQGHHRGCYFSLACSIGSIGIACGSLMQLSSTSDRISLQRGLFLTSLGFIYFVSLTDFFNKYLLNTKQGDRIRKKYRLMVSDVMDITNKIVSAIQACFSCLAGAIACKSSCSKSFLYASHFVMEAYAWFGTAYFMYDIWSMYKVHIHKLADRLISKCSSLPSNNGYNGIANNLYDKQKTSEANNMRENGEDHLKHHEDEVDIPDSTSLAKNNSMEFIKYIVSHPVMIMHHIFIGTFGLLVVTYLRGGTGDCVYSFIYLMEFSTPFVSIRSILSTMGLKNTRIYIINGITMLITFFICRIFMWPYVFYWYSEVINRPFVQAIMGLPRKCKIGILILFLPQIYWFQLMVRGALKVFLPSKRTAVSKIIRPETSRNNERPQHAENAARLLREIRESSPKRSVSPVNGRANNRTVMQGRSLL